MKKRLLAQILVLCMLFSMLPTTVWATAESEPCPYIEDVPNSGQISARKNLTVIATSSDLRITGMTLKAINADSAQEVTPAACGPLQASSDSSGCKTYKQVFVLDGDLKINGGKWTFEVTTTYRPAKGGSALKTSVWTLPDAHEIEHSYTYYTIVDGVPDTTRYYAASTDLTLHSSGYNAGDLAAVNLWGRLTEPAVRVVNRWGIPVTTGSVPTERATISPANGNGAWGISGVTTQSFVNRAGEIRASFPSLQPYTRTGEAFQNARVKYTVGAQTVEYGSMAAFNIPGAKVAVSNPELNAGQTVGVQVTEARDLRYALLTGFKSVTVTDVTNGASRCVFNSNVRFTGGEAVIQLPGSAFTEDTLSERRLDITISDIFQTLHTTLTVETAKTGLEAVGLAKVGENGVFAAVSGADITKPYDGGKTVPASLYAGWDVIFRDEDGRPVELEKSTDYRITSVEFEEKNVGSQAVIFAVELINRAAKDYSLIGRNTVRISGASITPKEITVAHATASDKVYDGRIDAQVIPSFSGLEAGETLTEDDYSVAASFADAVTGEGKAVSYTVTLNDSGTARNYTLAVDMDAALPKVEASIFSKALTTTLSFSVDNTGVTESGVKIQAGTILTAIPSIMGAVGDEQPILSYAWSVDGEAVEAVDDTYTVQAGDGTITVTADLAADGEGNAVNGNYIMTSTSRSVAVDIIVIEPTALALPEDTAITKVYDGNTSAALPAGTAVVFSAGDTVLEEEIGCSVKSVTYDSADVGNHTVTVVVELTGSDAYLLNKDTFTFSEHGLVTITKAEVSIPATNVSLPVGNSTVITIPTDGLITTEDGEVSGELGVPAKASFTISGPKVTITGVAAGTVYLRLQASEGANYQVMPITRVAITVIGQSISEPDITDPDPTPDSTPDPDPDDVVSAPSSPGSFTTTGGMATVNSIASVSSGAAFANVSADDVQSAVAYAAQHNSSNVVVRVDVPYGASVSFVQADLPVAAINDLVSRTTASLTVSTPLATVTIPNDSLYQMGCSTSSFAMSAASQGPGTVHVALTQDGRTVGALPSGMKVEIPVRNMSRSFGAAAVLVNPSGAGTVLPKSILKENGNLAVLLDIGSAAIRCQDNSKYFYDVNSGYWASDAIDFVSGHGLFQGITSTTFDGSATMNRAMLVTVLHRLEGTPRVGVYSFADVPAGSYYAQAAAWAASKGIVLGDGTGFGGGRAVTRQEIAVILYRYMQTINGSKGQMGSYYSMGGADQVADWASDAMRWAVGSGIIQGDNGSLKPRDSATRAEVSQMMVNFVKLITQ